MNWLDIIIIATWLVGFVMGWRMGLFGAIFTTGGLVVGFFLAARFSDNVSELITDSVSSDSLATVIAYAVIMIAVLVVAQILKGIVKGILRMVFLGWVDSVGGLALGLVAGVILSGAFITGFARYSSDLPTELLDKVPGGIVGNLPVDFLIERAGVQEKLHNALVESKLVPVFLDIRANIPGDALGFIPDDFKIALDVLEAELERK